MNNLDDIERCENTTDMFYNSSMNEFDRKVILSKIDEIDFNNEDDKYIKIVRKHLENANSHLDLPEPKGHSIFYDDYINAWRFFNYYNYNSDVLTKDILIELLK